VTSESHEVLPGPPEAMVTEWHVETEATSSNVNLEKAPCKYACTNSNTTLKCPFSYNSFAMNLQVFYRKKNSIHNLNFIHVRSYWRYMHLYLVCTAITTGDEDTEWQWYHMLSVTAVYLHIIFHRSCPLICIHKFIGEILIYF